MSTISNRFYVTALEDGTTLHGNLSVEGSTTQAWNGTAAVPDWTQPANQPTIYLTLLSGANNVQPDSDFEWYYNNDKLVFDGNNKSVAPYANMFEKTTKNVPIVGGEEGQTIAMPALKIIDNLASSTNVDVDTIMFKGTYSVSGSGVDLVANTQVRISVMSADGYLGVINFVDGIADITRDNQTITMYAALYGGASGGIVNGYTVQWYVNDIPYNASDTTHFTPNKTITKNITVGGRTYPAFDLYEDDVVDNAVIRCEFLKGGNSVCSTYTSVDDMQDPEFMYIQYNGGNGNAASLRKGDSATFYIWVGKREDQTVDVSFAHFQVKFLKGDGTVITGAISGMPADAGGGWRNMTVDTGTNKASITLTYEFVSGQQKNVTGIVRASTSAFA